MHRRTLLTATAAAAAAILPACAMARAPRGPLFLNTVLLGGEPGRTLRAARAAGFDQVELWTDDVEGFAGGAPAARGLAASIGLGFTDYQVLLDFDGAPGDRRVEKRRKAIAMLDIARTLGTRTMLVPASTDPDCDRARIGEDMAWLVGEAKARGIRIAHEGMAWSSVHPRLGDAWAVMRDLDPAHAGIVVDAYHLLVPGGRVDEIAAIPPERIFLAQFCDVAGPVAPADYKQVARTSRLLPGDGVLPLVDLARRLRETGYRGPLGLEVFNERMEAHDPGKVAADAYASLVRLLERAGW